MKICNINKVKEERNTGSSRTNETFESQEKHPFLIEIAGCPGSIGGFGKRTLSSVDNTSSKRFKDTLAFTIYKSQIKRAIRSNYYK